MKVLARFMGDRNYSSTAERPRKREVNDRFDSSSIAIILVTLLLAGCGKPKPEVIIGGAGSRTGSVVAAPGDYTEIPLTDAQKIEPLHKEAHKRAQDGGPLTLDQLREMKRRMHNGEDLTCKVKNGLYQIPPGGCSPQAEIGLGVYLDPAYSEPE